MLEAIKKEFSDRAARAEDMGLQLQALSLVAAERKSTTLADHAAQLLLAVEGAQRAGFTTEEVINAAWLRLCRKPEGKEQAS